MEINKEDNILQLEPSDLGYVLHEWLKTYKFYNQGKTPTKITIPKLAAVKDYNTDVKIPIVYTTQPAAVEKKESPNDSSRPQ